MSLGDYLVYDDTLNKVWYSDLSAFYGTYEETMALTGTLTKTAMINGMVVNLNWRGASTEEVATLDLTDLSTRSHFTPAYSAGYIDSYGPDNEGDPALFGLSFYRYVYSARSGLSPNGEPYYYPSIPDGSGSMTVLRRYIWVLATDPNMAFLNVSEPERQSWESWSNQSEYQWIISDINPAPVPEPTTIILIGSGLLGLAGFRKKIKKL